MFVFGLLNKVYRGSPHTQMCVSGANAPPWATQKCRHGLPRTLINYIKYGSYYKLSPKNHIKIAHYLA